MTFVPPSLRSTALADITPRDLEWMVNEGEALIELKADIPNAGIGPAVASFANSLGGWIVLGVEDTTRQIVGWKPKGRADVIDSLREMLRREVDPMPPFAAKPMDVGGRRVGLVRVYESADTPHIIRGTGSVYIREPGGKRPIETHTELIQLARRGEDAKRQASERLRTLPAVGFVLQTPDSGYENEEDRDIRWIARGAPVTLSPVTRDWPLTRRAADWCSACVDRMVGNRPPYPRTGPDLEPFGRAIAARVTQQTGSDAGDRAAVVADSGGVVGVELTRGVYADDRPRVLIEAMREESIRPLLQEITAMLSAAEAWGRAVVDVWCLFPQEDVHGVPQQPTLRDLHVAREVTIPADDAEVGTLADSFHRELQRNMGLMKFEDGGSLD